MSEYRKEVRGIAGESWWTLGKVLSYVVLPLFVLGGVLSVLGVFGAVASAPGRVINRTVETDNIIYNYEWFKRQHQQIIAVSGMMADAEKDLSEFPLQPNDFQSAAEFSRLHAVLSGLRNQRRNYVAEYNARAHMANRSIFMGRDLPSEEQ